MSKRGNGEPSLTTAFFAHIKLLYTWLMNQEKLSSLFTTMSEISAKKLCKEMEFRHLKGGEVVVNQGEKGNTCFVSSPTAHAACAACVSLTLVSAGLS